MLYFDWLVEQPFGTIRLQVWSFVHFPLHLSLVLLVSGVSQFLIWRQAVESINVLSNQIAFDLRQPYNTSIALSARLSATIDGNVFKQLPKDFNPEKGLKAINESLAAISEIRSVPVMDLLRDQTGPFWVPFRGLLTASTNTILEALGIKPPKSEDEKPDSTSAIMQTFSDGTKFQSVIRLVFVYFFLSAGATLILLGVLACISTTQRNFIGYLRYATNFLVGLALSFLSFMSLTNAESSYGSSPWVLPTVCLSLGLGKDILPV